RLRVTASLAPAIVREGCARATAGARPVARWERATARPERRAGGRSTGLRRTGDRNRRGGRGPGASGSGGRRRAARAGRRRQRGGRARRRGGGRGAGR